MRKLFYIFLFLFVFIPMQSSVKVDYFTLSNGLTVLLSPDHKINSVCVLTYHKNGVTSDPPNIRGASYLYQGLMFLKTEHLSPYERIRFVMKNGGRSSGKVNYDNSVFYQVVPASDLNYALWLENERILKLNLSDREIINQRAKVYKRIYKFINGSIHFRAEEWIRKELYGNSVYKTPLYGDIDKLNVFNSIEIRRIYRHFSDPKNIILTISGNFDENEIRGKIKKYFSNLESKSIKIRNPVTIPLNYGYKYKNWMREVIPESFIIFGIRAPSKLSLDYAYFKLLVYYLVDKRVSKLKRIFKSNLKMKIRISFNFSDNIGANVLLIKTSSKKRSELEKVRFYIRKLFDMLMKDKLPLSELNSIKSLIEIDFLKKVTNLETRSLILAENFHMSGNIDSGNIFLKRIRKISSFDMVRICKKYLRKENMVILNVFSK